MTNYADKTGRLPDFRVKYRWHTPDSGVPYQRPFQHIRSDFMYERDDPQADGMYMIWPEFERDDGVPWAEEAEIPTVGFASMWILSKDLRALHRARLAPGVRGFMMAGPHKIADVEVIELIGIGHEVAGDA